MRIELDFDRKIVTLKHDVNIGELNEKLKKLIPDWKDWKIEAVKYETTYFPYYPYNPIINTPVVTYWAGTTNDFTAQPPALTSFAIN